MTLKGALIRILLLGGLLFVLGCTASNVGGENRVLYDDSIAREMLVDALRAQKIAYRIDAGGGLWYLAKNEKAVDEIAKKIVLTRFSGPATSFEDPADVLSFRSKLTQAGIPYGSTLQHGREWTTWGKSDDLRVKEIQEKVENENMERAKVGRAEAEKASVDMLRKFKPDCKFECPKL